jgi:hypothetical protein
MGGKILIKNSLSQQVMTSQQMDPMGNYLVSLPSGIYDIVLVSSSGDQIQEKKNQNITANTVTNFSLPSSPENKSSKIPFTWLHVLLSIITFLALGIGYLLWKKR